ncbi:hypothetical protein INT45_002811 [Circinella minor]|uniref:SPX domain-containing protein n=1 Tax=Circinella minor TaxID=1195481 RepID=A0A8H7S051_9FUNG|nr:hypothetical protein INT45_002811 [Circinella minor]
MTFQPNNIYESWRFEYVSYNLIKQDITTQAKNYSWLDRDESSFVASLWHEAEKVDRFITQKQRELESTLAHCRRSFEKVSNNSNSYINYHTTETLHNVYCELKELSDFARHNALALQHLINYHDELTGRSQLPLLVEILRKKRLDRQRFDVTLIETVKLMDIVSKQLESPQQEQLDQQQQQPIEPNTDYKHKKEERKEPQWQHEPTAVHFWVHQDNITQVLAILHFHLSSSSSRPTINFLDNQQYELYQGRLERDEGAEEIRIKHFASASKDAILERETYHAGWMNEQRSVTDGFRLESLDKVKQFLSFQYTAEEAVNDLCTTDVERRTLGFIASGIQKSISEKQLRPVMCMSSERTVFQDQVVFDQNICFAGDGNNKYNLPYAILQATLNGNPREYEVDWLKTLLRDGLIYEVPSFSLYLHGVACLWPQDIPLLPWWMNELSIDIRDARQLRGFLSANEFTHSKNLRPEDEPLGYLNHELEYPQVRTSERPVIKEDMFSSVRHESISIDKDFFYDPVWQDNEEQEGAYQRARGRRSQQEQHEHNNNQEEQVLLEYGGLSIYEDDDDDNLLANQQDRQEEEKKEKKKNKKAPWLEPKVFFANERTFIHWLQFSALILVSALTLLNFGDRVSTIAGGVFFGISLVIALYAYGRFRYRTHQIRTRPHIRYDDIYGPIGLCILLVGALVLNFILRYTSPNSTTSWLGINNSTQQQNPGRGY